MKSVVITGAGSAIAVPTIQRFKEAGWRLTLIELEQERWARLKTTHPDALVLYADLTDAAEAAAAIAASSDRAGPITALLNLVESQGRLDESENAEEMERQFDLNFRTLVHTTRAALPGMVRAGQGFILGLGASSALRQNPQGSAYAASKAAMVAYLGSLQAELEPRGIGVSILYPVGVIDTPDARRCLPDPQPERWIDACDLADSIFHLATRSKRGRIRELKVFAPGLEAAFV